MNPVELKNDMSFWQEMAEEISYDISYENLSKALLEDIVSQYGDYEVRIYDGVSYIVLNMKMRGLPDWGELLNAVREKYPDISDDEFEELEDELGDYLDDKFYHEVSSFHGDLVAEVGSEVSVVGRSGGWWGFDATDIDFIIRPACLRDVVLNDDDIVSDIENAVDSEGGF